MKQKGEMGERKGIVQYLFPYEKKKSKAREREKASKLKNHKVYYNIKRTLKLSKKNIVFYFVVLKNDKITKKNSKKNFVSTL